MVSQLSDNCVEKYKPAPSKKAASAGTSAPTQAKKKQAGKLNGKLLFSVLENGLVEPSLHIWSTRL